MKFSENLTSRSRAIVWGQTDRQILYERNRLFFYARAQQLAKVPGKVSLAILQNRTAMTSTYTVACYDVTFETAVCFKFRYCRP